MFEYPVISRNNNFDLVRLFAALQVVFFHIQNRCTIVVPGMNWFSHLPGVPIFFTVSGFLITASFLRNRDRIISYFINRYLRIYPAIYMLILVTTIAAILTYSISWGNIFSMQYVKWIVMWTTYDQNFTPPIWSGFGIGTPNGSLWTIPVELSFYILIPIVFAIKNKKILFFILGILLICSITTNYLFFSWDYFFVNNTWKHTYSMSLIPHLFWFLFGSIMYLGWDKIRLFLEDKFFFYFIPLVILLVLHELFPTIIPTTEMRIQTFGGFLMSVLLSISTISAAFSFKNASKILRGNDLSYGIYLYHGLIINVLIELTDNRTYWLYPIVYILTIICGWLSWHYIENPCLALKNKIITHK